MSLFCKADTKASKKEVQPTTKVVTYLSSVSRQASSYLASSSIPGGGGEDLVLILTVHL